MTTHTPITHIYKEVNKGKYKITRHYELVDVQNRASKLSKLLNISNNRNFAQSTPDFWLKIKQGKKWSDYITGLFKTDIKNLYKGDIDHKKHLLLFRFSEDTETLTVYHFKNHYTNDLSNLLPFIKE